MTSSTETPAAVEDAAARTRSWVHGGLPTRWWRVDTFAWCLIALGAGAVAGALVSSTVGTVGGVDSGLVVLWACLAVPVVMAFRRGIPQGLLRFRWLDVLYGVVLGVALRFAQGSLSVAAGASPALPGVPVISEVPVSFWLTQAAAVGLVGPVVEEFFFRGTLLVCLYLVVRRWAGRGQAAQWLAGFVAVIGSAGLFVLGHALPTALTADAAVSLLLVGVVAGALVVGTRRIWGAVVLHVVYNGMLVALTLVGTVWA